MDGEERTKQFNVYLPVSLIRDIKLLAIDQERSLASITRDALRDYVDAQRGGRRGSRRHP